MKTLFTSVNALVCLAITAGAAVDQDAGIVEELIVTGTRTTGLRAVDSPITSGL
jgi:hypothetical protein